jgi:hypothetical protein
VGGEFVPDIAHAIHEQLGAYHRRVYSFLDGDSKALHGGASASARCSCAHGRLIPAYRHCRTRTHARSVLAPQTGRSYRDLGDADDWAPQLTLLNEGELEKHLEGRERTHRYGAVCWFMGAVRRAG